MKASISKHLPEQMTPISVLWLTLFVINGMLHAIWESKEINGTANQAINKLSFRRANKVSREINEALDDELLLHGNEAVSTYFEYHL